MDCSLQVGGSRGASCPLDFLPRLGSVGDSPLLHRLRGVGDLCGLEAHSDVERKVWSWRRLPPKPGLSTSGKNLSISISGDPHPGATPSTLGGMVLGRRSSRSSGGISPTPPC